MQFKYQVLPLVLPASIIIGSLIIGLLFERWILPKLIQRTSGGRWSGDEVVFKSLKGLIIIWITIAGAYAALLNIPLTPETISSIRTILQIILIFTLAIALARMAAGFIRRYALRSSGAPHAMSIFANAARGVIMAIGLVMILQAVGISITPILTALGVGGLAVALALQDTLTNVFAGIQILLSNQIRHGNYIKLSSGEEGYLADITWRNSTIRMTSNNTIVIPNSKLSSQIVTNYYLPSKELAVFIDVGVAYDCDLEHVERVTVEVGNQVMREAKGGVPEFNTLIRFHTFADSNINFTAILRAKEYTDQPIIKHEFVKRLSERYRIEGIDISYPTQKIFLQRNLESK
ncbi:MAG: mechanosensitive ion channel family protein [Pyrinomonadaceae bacterium]